MLLPPLCRRPLLQTRSEPFLLLSGGLAASGQAVLRPRATPIASSAIVLSGVQRTKCMLQALGLLVWLLKAAGVAAEGWSCGCWGTCGRCARLHAAPDGPAVAQYFCKTKYQDECGVAGCW